MRMKCAVLLTSFFMAAAAVSAAESQPKPVFGERIAPGDLPQLIEMIRFEVQPGGRWEYVPKRELPKLEEKLAEMERVIAGRSSIEELSDDERIRLINAQEHANAILTQHDGRRLVCERYTPTGSHRPQKRCMTLAERERATAESRRFLDSVQSRRALKASN
jgi:TolA-binding protein